MLEARRRSGAVCVVLVVVVLVVVLVGGGGGEMGWLSSSTGAGEGGEFMDVEVVGAVSVGGGSREEDGWGFRCGAAMTLDDRKNMPTW